MSLCQGILDAVVPVARANGATRITAITLDIGEMTMVVPESMDFAFEVLTEGEPLLEGVELSMNFITPHSRCLDCGAEFDHSRYNMRCPSCDSPMTTLLAGRELSVASMEIETPDDEEE